MPNQRLAELDIEARIDHRTLEAQGIGLEPQNKIGPAGMRREERDEDSERIVEHRQIARRNGERIIAEPTVALEAITRQQSTFTDHDLARFVHRHTDDPDQYAKALSAVKTSPELVALGVDGRGRERFSTREMIEVEQRLERSADQIAERSGHEVSPAAIRGALTAGERRGLHAWGTNSATPWSISLTRAISPWLSAMPVRVRARCWAWPARGGRRPATRCAGPPCRGSPPRASRRDRGSARGPSPVSSTAGRKGATS